MKTKLKVILLAAQIELCWLFIKAWQKMVENYFIKEGGYFTSYKSMKLYKHLQHHCDRATLLTYKFQKLTSMGKPPMEHEKPTVTMK